MPWFHVQLLHATRCNNCRHSNMQQLHTKPRLNAATQLPTRPAVTSCVVRTRQDTESMSTEGRSYNVLTTISEDPFCQCASGDSCSAGSSVPSLTLLPQLHAMDRSSSTLSAPAQPVGRRFSPTSSTSSLAVHQPVRRTHTVSGRAPPSRHVQPLHRSPARNRPSKLIRRLIESTCYCCSKDTPFQNNR